MKVKAIQKIEVELDRSEVIHIIQEHLVKTGRWEHDLLIDENNVIRAVSMGHLGVRYDIVRNASAEDHAFYKLYLGH